MNYQDSSSDDVPYLPPDQYNDYEQKRNSQRLSQSEASLSQAEQRRGRSYFSEDEIRELDGNDGPAPAVLPVSSHHVPPPTINTIPTPPSISDILRSSLNEVSNYDHTYDRNESGLGVPHQPRRNYEISWGRRFIGILLIIIPAVFLSVAVHFIDWSMSDFQLFSASFFIFQGVFWPSFGILLSDLFCAPKKSIRKLDHHHDSSHANHAPRSRSAEKNDKSGMPKWVTFSLTMVHSNLASVAMILQLLSIQKLNISISLALSFGFDAVLLLTRYILETGRFSLELIILSIISYVGYGVTAVPAFIADDENVKTDTAIGVGASVGVMLLSIPSSLLLTKLRQQRVKESMIGTSFAFFGCIHSLITKEIMGSAFNLRLDGRAVGWVAGLISVVFLGTIFLFLESKLSALIWQRDDDRPREFSSITRTRVAVFILSCLWELSRSGFRDAIFPELYDIFGGFLVMLSFLLACGYQAWYRSCQNGLATTATADSACTESSNRQISNKFCAFLPWLFAQKSYHVKN